MAGPLVALGLAGLTFAAGAPPPIGSFDDLGRAVAACVRTDVPTAGLELELRFTLTARGTLAGRPTVVVARATPATAAERALAATFLDALRRCTPFPLIPAFARSIAGHAVTLKVLTGARAVVV